jgi:adenylate kinase
MTLSKWMVLLGPPGCGKGTQSEYLVEKCGFMPIVAGDILRSGRDKLVGETGKTVGEIMDTGALLPGSIVSELIKNELDNMDDASSKNILFDGYPRSVQQAEDLNGFAARFGRKLDCVLNFAIDLDMITKRITGRFKCAVCGKIYNDFLSRPSVDGICDVCGATEFIRRADDNEESLKKRLSEYREKTGPLVDFYAASQVLRSVDASLASNMVSELIVDILGIRENR